MILQILNDQGEKSILRKRIDDKFWIVMIDEFQDTNKIQYRIIDAIFIRSSVRRSNENTRGLFLIGDPKQSIYGFRNADIASYLDIKRQRHFSIHSQSTNWRSTEKLIKAINALFSVQNPFLYKEIDYSPVSDSKEFREEEIDSPLHLWIWKKDPSHSNSPQNNNVLRKEFASKLILEIKRKLERGISPSNIVVLVRGKRDLFFLQKLFLRWGIPHKISDQSHYLASDEAMFTLQFLSAVAFPNERRYTRAVLLTPFFSNSRDEISTLSKENWQEVVKWFQELQNVWCHQGLNAMLGMVMSLISSLSSSPSSPSFFLEIGGKLISQSEERYRQWEKIIRFLLSKYAHYTNPSIVINDFIKQIDQSKKKSGHS